MGDRAIVQIMNLVEFWHIHARNVGQLPKGRSRSKPDPACRAAALDALALHPLDGIDDIVDDFLALADHERVDEGVHRLGVGGGVPAGDDDRMRSIAVC